MGKPASQPHDGAAGPCGIHAHRRGSPFIASRRLATLTQMERELILERTRAGTGRWPLRGDVGRSKTMPVAFWLICFSDTIKGALRQFYVVVLLPDGTVVEPTVAKRL